MFRNHTGKVKPHPSTTEPTWRRCGDCGRVVSVPPDPRGKCFPKRGEPLTRTREA